MADGASSKRKYTKAAFVSTKKPKKNTLASLNRRVGVYKELAQVTEGAPEPKFTRFVTELVRSGGSVTKASKAIGIAFSTGYAWLKRPEIRELYDSFNREAQGYVRDWGELLAQAQRTLVDLLDSEDDRIRRDVAIYLVDRNLGKVSQKIDATVTHQEALTDIQLHAALSLVSEQGLSWNQATRYVKEHADEVAEWAARQIETNARAPMPQIGPESGAGVTIPAEVVSSHPSGGIVR